MPGEITDTVELVEQHPEAVGPTVFHVGSPTWHPHPKGSRLVLELLADAQRWAATITPPSVQASRTTVATPNRTTTRTDLTESY